MLPEVLSWLWRLTLDGIGGKGRRFGRGYCEGKYWFIIWRFADAIVVVLSGANLFETLRWRRCAWGLAGVTFE